MTIQSQIVAGDTLDFETRVEAFPRTAGWNLTYKLIPFAAGIGPITILATGTAADDADYRVQVGPSITTGWASGSYSWMAYVHKSGARHTVDQGTLKILPNPESAQSYDSRSHSRKMLLQVESAMEALNLGTQSMTIGSRSWTKRDMPELILLRDRYKAEIANEEALDRVASGLANPRRAGIRFIQR
jgi:hypothetical protein